MRNPFRRGTSRRRYSPDEAAHTITDRDAEIRMLKRELAVQAATNEWLTAELTVTRARLANATAVTVGQVGWRDTSDPVDQVTVPQGIDVRPLWDAAATGLLDTANPAHVPAERIDLPHTRGEPEAEPALPHPDDADTAALPAAGGDTGERTGEHRQPAPA